MDKTTIFQRIQKVENEVALLNNTLFALKSTDIVKYGANYTELSTNATLRAERIACQLRNLVLFTDFKGNSTYMIQAADALGIKSPTKTEFFLQRSLDFSPNGDSTRIWRFYGIRCMLR